MRFIITDFPMRRKKEYLKKEWQTMLEGKVEVREGRPLQKSGQFTCVKTALVFLLPVLVGFTSLFAGRYQVTPIDVLRILLSPVFPLAPGVLEREASIVLVMRLPRTCFAMLTGAGLAVSGAAFQALFRNPLVSPDILGVTAGTAFGAVLGLLIFGNMGVIPYFSIPFGVATILMVFLLSRSYKNGSILFTVLGGIVVSSVFSALISLAKFVADPYDRLPAITYWLMGSFSRVSYSDLMMAAPPVLGGIVLLLLLRWKINILSLGEEEAKTLGLNTQILQWMVIGAVTVIVAFTVSVTGIIGWVGLLIPHIGRMVAGPDNRVLMPITCSLGAAFLCGIDLLARSLTGVEIPIGVLTAIMGAPFFIFLMIRLKGYSV